MNEEAWLARLIGALVVVVAWFLVGVALVLFRRWTRRRWENEMLRRPNLPCAHRFIRLRWKVDEGELVEPKPECVDCGAEVLNVRVKGRRTDLPEPSSGKKVDE